MFRAGCIKVLINALKALQITHWMFLYKLSLIRSVHLTNRCYQYEIVDRFKKKKKGIP